MGKLEDLGYMRVKRNPRTGELLVDTDSNRRSDFSGDDDDLGDDDDVGDEDDDDDLEGDDDDVGDDEELGADDGDDIGARRRRRRRRGKISRKEARTLGLRGRRKMKWAGTAVGGSDTLTAAGTATVRIRLQHHFKAEDVTFAGSPTSAKVTSISFGDRPVWSNPDGISVEVFGATSTMRNILRGQAIRAGLDIIVNGTLDAAGTFSVTITGKKPANSAC